MIAAIGGVGSLSLSQLGGAGAGEQTAAIGLGEASTGSGRLTAGSGEAAGVGSVEGAGGLQGTSGAEGTAGIEALGGAEGASGTQSTGGEGGGFGDALTNAISSLDQSQQRAGSAAQGLATGSVSDPEAAVVTVEEAQLAMQLASQIRTKATEAVQQVFQTQV
jgi:flagellar hook-basal body complex protein FliE